MSSSTRSTLLGPDHAWYETAPGPIVTIHFPPVFSDKELAGALAAVERWLLEEVDAPFGFIVDMQRPLSINSVQRRMMAAAEARYAHVDLRFNAGQALVVPTAISRGIVTAISWVSPPVYPIQTFADMDSAKIWVQEELRLGIADFPSGPHWSRRKGWTPA